MPSPGMQDAPSTRLKRPCAAVLLVVPALLGAVHLLHGADASLVSGAAFLTPAAFALPAVAPPRLPAVEMARVAPQVPAEAGRSRGAVMSVDTAVEGAPCADDEPAVSDDSRVTGTTLRSIQLKDVKGRTVEMKDSMGAADGKAVVVFLRHLGWPFCWDYALKWEKEKGRLNRAGVAGPIFVSVGQPSQLQKFLDLNPELAYSTAFVDDSDDFQAYRKAGFRSMLGDEAMSSPPSMKPPDSLNPVKWFAYLRNVITLSPQPKGGMKFGEVPQGVRVLGGTYAVSGDAVVFNHQDKVPGATPDIADVLRAVGA